MNFATCLVINVIASRLWRRGNPVLDCFVATLLAMTLMCNANAQSPQNNHTLEREVEIGLLDNVKKVYISSNTDYFLIQNDANESNSDNKSTEYDQATSTKTNIIAKFKAHSKTLVRISPKTASDFVIVNKDQMLTVNGPVKLVSNNKFNSNSPSTSSQTQISGKFSSNKRFSYSENEIAYFVINKNKFSKAQETQSLLGKYRGAIVISPSVQKESLTVVNRIDLEDYLKGVVASEMPSSWHAEALKAQAVCARTYTLANLNRRRSQGYDLKSNVEDQMYLGYDKETASANLAVEQTAGQVLIDKTGQFIDAYYYSSAGKYTAAPEYVWGLEPKHYLIQKTAVDDSPYKSWLKRFSFSELDSKLADLRLGKISTLTILQNSPEGRVTKVLVSSGDRASHLLITGEELRHKLGLPSTFFDISFIEDKIAFSGQGFGHGIGMSQYGAKYMAERGYSYKDILGHFYPGTQLKNRM